jgi:hypothetical protein
VLEEEIALYLMERDGSASPPRAIDLDRVIVMVPKGRGGEVARFSARGVEVAQVRAARRALRNGSAGARRVGSEERAIRSALARKRALAEVSVTVASGRASFGNVPLGALDDLAAALRAVRVESGLLRARRTFCDVAEPWSVLALPWPLPRAGGGWGEGGGGGHRERLARGFTSPT